jgi:hypothetical protein
MRLSLTYDDTKVKTSKALQLKTFKSLGYSETPSNPEYRRIRESPEILLLREGIKR